MLLTEYNEKLHIDNEKEISYEAGLAKGMQKGIQKGEDITIKQMKEVRDCLRAGAKPEDIINSGISKKIVDAALELLS